MRAAAAVALSGVGLILVALTFDAAILFVPAIALVLLAILLPAWIKLAVRRTTLDRRLHASRVVEDQPLEATLVIGHGRLGLPGATIIEPLASAPMSLRIPPTYLRPGATELRVVARFERRGRRVLPPPRLEVGDLLGIVRLSRTGTGDGQEVLVLPRTERVRSLSADPSGPFRAGSSPSPEPLAAIEVDGLRAYQQGTPASRIHWLALARGAGLLERRLRAEGGLAPLVVVDGRCATPGEPLDRAVRAAASLVLELARRGGCELLLPGDRRAIAIAPDLGAWPGAHARLALLEGGPATPPPALTQRLGKVFYVVADQPERSLRGAIERVRAAFVVVPRELASGMRGRPAFEVAGCVGYSVGLGSRSRRPEREQAA